MAKSSRKILPLLVQPEMHVAKFCEKIQNLLIIFERMTMAPYESEELLLLLKTRNVSHFGLAIYIKKHLKAKEELRKLKYFTIAKI
jgi:hypothetical protein